MGFWSRSVNLAAYRHIDPQMGRDGGLIALAQDQCGGSAFEDSGTGDCLAGGEAIPGIDRRFVPAVHVDLPVCGGRRIGPSGGGERLLVLDYLPGPSASEWIRAGLLRAQATEERAHGREPCGEQGSRPAGHRPPVPSFR